MKGGIGGQSKRRITAGIAANAVTQVSQLFARLAEVPLLIGLWGTSVYGEWLMLAALPTAFSFADGGITRAARRDMAVMAGAGNYLAARSTYQCAFVALVALSTLFIVITAWALRTIDLSSLMGLSAITSANATLIFLLLSGQVLAFLQCSLLHGVFIADGKYALGEICMAICLSLGFLGVAIGAWIGGTPLWAAVGSFCGYVAGLTIMSLVIASNSNTRGFLGVQKASVAGMRALVKPSLAGLAFPVSDAISVQGSRVLVGIIAGPLMLVLFSVTRTLCRAALQPVLAIARTTEPEVSLAHGAGRTEEIRFLLLRATHFGFWLSLTLCVAVACVAPIAFEYWVDGGLGFSPLVLALLLGASLINVLWGSAMVVPFGTGAYTRASPAFFIAYGLGTPCILVTSLIVRESAANAALAILIAETVALVVVLRYSLKSSRMPLADWLSALRPPTADSISSVFKAAKSLIGGPAR